MSGRGGGRGRGRGIPITYPDGWASKPNQSAFPGVMPLALNLEAADKQMLNFHRGLRHSSAVAMFTVADPQASADISRYSDRYRQLPKGPFGKASVSVTLHSPMTWSGIN